MTSPDPSPALEGSSEVPETGPESPRATEKVAAMGVTRASAAWVATGVSLALLTLMIIFILQNQTSVELHFLGFDGSIPVGVAVLIAAVCGGVLVAVSGVARVVQLRRDLRRTRRAEPTG